MTIEDRQALACRNRIGGRVEQEAREMAAVTRGQNVVYVMPHDWASITRFLEPLIEKIEPGQTDLQVLVITPDPDAAAAVAGAAVRLLRDRDVQILAATSSPRASRLLKLRPAQIVVGTPDTIVQLMRSASLKLDAVRQICIAWADELLARGDAAPLETLMADVPKDAARTIVVAETPPAVEELLERYARRARRVASPSAEGTPPTAIEYVATSPSARLNTLRRVLDLADPASAVVFVREGDSTREVNDLLRSMGYGADDAVRVAVVAAPGTALAVLFDLPASREELREAVGAASRAVALVQPRQLASLRALAAGGMVKPLTLPDSMKSAREQDAQLRAQVRAILDDGKFGRALLAMEPLLEDYDGSEVAAAAVTLLEREREAHRTSQTATAGSAHRDPASMVRLFVTVGSRDGARPGDLVGAMANQGGVSSAELGKVDVRESHSVVEVSANVADALIERLNGTTIKGRRALVRRDEPARGGRGDRPDRGARGDRGERGDRPSRGPGGPPRGGDRPERRPSRGPRREGGRDRE